MRRLAIMLFAAAVLALAFAPLIAVAAQAPPPGLQHEITRLEHTRDSLDRREAALRTRLAAARADSACLAMTRGTLAGHLQCLGHASAAPTPRAAASAPAALRIAGPVIAAALGYTLGQLDPDAGGYRDPWTGPDKQLHGALGAAGCATLRGASVGWKTTLVTLAAGAVAYELGQSAHGGYRSWRDVAWSSGGCLTALTVSSALGKLRGP